ncbi:MAG: hypothetical protein ACKOKC_00605 [Chthoniobacterales bacterium]
MVLYESLRRHLPEAILHVLALSDECEQFLLRADLSGMVVVPIFRILEDEPRLAKARPMRSETEFIFTLTPYIVLETLKACRSGEHAVYLDADMMFFSSPADFVKTSDAFDVSITPHNFSSHMQDQARFGIYNVGWVGFKKTTGGERCANWWAEQCLGWCHDRLENGKFADQKYLESFDKIASSVQTSNPVGLNCAPWNASGHRFHSNGQTVLVDGQPLILYHFAKVKRINPWCIATRTKLQGVIGAKGLNRCVYRPYAQALKSASDHYEIPAEWSFRRSNPRHGVKYRGFERDEAPGRLSILARILRGDYVASKSTDIFKIVGHSQPAPEPNGRQNAGTELVSPQNKIPTISLVTPSFNQSKWGWLAVKMENLVSSLRGR